MDGLGYLPWSSSQVRNLREKSLATMRPYKPDQFCPYLLGTAQFDNSPPEEEIEQVEAEEAKTEETNLLPVQNGTGIQDRTKWLLLGGLIGVVIGLLLGAIAGATIFRPDSPMPEMVTEVETVEVTRLEEVIKEVTKIAEVTRIVSEEVPMTVIVEGAAREIEVTREVTSEAQSPVDTPLPVDTSEAIQTSTRTISLVEIIDNFDGDELADWWTRIGGGDLTLGGGVLATDNDLLLEMGDESWENYVIEVDVVRTVSGITRGNYIEFLKTEEDGLLVTFDRGLGSRIFMLENGEWEEDGRTVFRQNSEGKTIRVEVKDGRVDVWMDGTPVVENHITPLTAGKVGLKITNGTIIDAFRINPLE
jgi:hypothetical protein